MVVVTLCRAAFGSLADSVIEVPPFDVQAAGAAAGQSYDTVLLSLAALLVRHMGLNAAGGAADAVAANGGADSSDEQERRLRLEESDPGSSGSGAAAAAPPAPQRRPVREELRRLGLSESRFAEAALGLLGGECPAAVSYVLEDMAPQRNPQAPHPQGRLHAHAGSSAMAAAAGPLGAPEVVLEEEIGGAGEAGPSPPPQQQQPWHQHEAATDLTPLQLSRLELVDLRADMGLPASPVSPADLPSPSSLPAASPAAAAAASSAASPPGSSACSGTSSAFSASGISTPRWSAASAAPGSAGGAADEKTPGTLVPSCLSLRWRSARRRALDQGDQSCESTSSCSTPAAPAELGSTPGTGAQPRPASPLKAAFRRLTAVVRKSLRSRAAETVDALAGAAAPEAGTHSPSSLVQAATPAPYCSHVGAHAPSAFAAAAACDESSVPSEPESCGAVVQSTVSVSAGSGFRVPRPGNESSELLAQRYSDQSDSSRRCSTSAAWSVCSAATLGSGLSGSTVASSVSGCVSAGHDCLTYDSSGSVGSSGGGAAGMLRPLLTRGRSSETLYKVLGVTQPVRSAAAPHCALTQSAAAGAATLTHCKDADADAPAMAAAAARMLNAAMRVRCPELPGSRIALLCGQPTSAGSPAEGLRAKSGFVTPVRATLALGNGAYAAADSAADAPGKRLPVQDLPCATGAASVSCDVPLPAIATEPEACVDLMVPLEGAGADTQEAAQAWTPAASEGDERSSRPMPISAAALSSASFTSSSSAAAAAVFGEGCSGGGSRVGSLEALERASLSEPGMLSRMDPPLSLHRTLDDSFDEELM